MMPEPRDLSTPLSWALAYATIGWHVLPLEPGQKQPLGRLVPRGMLDATVDQQTIRDWWRKAPRAGVGIALAQSGLVAVDVDPRNGGTETFEQLQVEHGSLRSDVMAFTGGGGEHHVFVVAEGSHVSLPGTLGPGIDLKANGYIVVEPSLHPNGKAYGWEASSSPLDGVAPSPLPDWLRSLRIDLKPRPPMEGDTPVNPHQARDAREALYLLDVDEYHDWLRAGMALHSTGWGHPGYAMWCAWSQQSTKFDASVCRHKWDSFKAISDREARGITMAWLFGEAQARGWQNPAKTLVRLPSDEAPPVDPEAPRLVLTMAELDAEASALRWAVKGIIPEKSVGFFYGASGTFKSFLALDYALHRCYGMRWMGRRTKQATPVYLAAEGGAGLLRRVKAWHAYRGLTWEDCPMRCVIVPMTLRTHSRVLRQAVESCGVEPGDLIIDTMSQTFTGNENSNDEVADWLRVIGSDLRDGIGCAVSVVHHSGHSATERPRGASAIIANIDFALGVFRDEKEMVATLEFSKIKDAERPDAETFELVKVELGRDDDGDAITSLTACHVRSVDLEELMQREALAGRSDRKTTLLRLVQSGMRERELRKSFYEALIDVADIDKKKVAYYRARDWAIKAGFFEIAGADRVVISLKEFK